MASALKAVSNFSSGSLNPSDEDDSDAQKPRFEHVNLSFVSMGMLPSSEDSSDTSSAVKRQRVAQVNSFNIVRRLLADPKNMVSSVRVFVKVTRVSLIQIATFNSLNDMCALMRSCKYALGLFAREDCWKALAVVRGYRTTAMFSLLQLKSFWPQRRELCRLLNQNTVRHFDIETNYQILLSCVSTNRASLAKYLNLFVEQDLYDCSRILLDACDEYDRDEATIKIAKKSKHDFLDALLRKGISENGRGEALASAMDNTDRSVYSTILKSGPISQAYRGELLVYAAQEGHFDFFIDLLNLRGFASEDGGLALISAVEKNHLEIAKTLLTRSREVYGIEIKPKHFRRALREAKKIDNPEMMQLLNSISHHFSMP